MREDDDGGQILGLRAEDRHANHRGTVQVGLAGAGEVVRAPAVWVVAG